MTSGSVLEVEILNPYKSFSAIILLNNLLSPPTFIFFSEILMTQKADLSLQSHRSLTCCSFFFFFQSVFLLSELQVGTSMQFCLLIYHFFPLLWSPSLEFEISLIVFFSSKTSVWFFRSSVSSLRLFFFFLECSQFLVELFFMTATLKTLSNFKNKSNFCIISGFLSVNCVTVSVEMSLLLGIMKDFEIILDILGNYITRLNTR